MNKLFLALAAAVALVGPLALTTPLQAQSTFHDRPLGYVRLDTTLRENQFWLGGAVPVDKIDLQGDLLLEGRKLEGDVGISFHAGGLSVLPMLGVSFNFDAKNFDRLVMPRVFTVLEGGPIYLESWVQLTLRSFHHDGTDEFYTRDFLLVVFDEHFAVGPQVELRWALHNPALNQALSLPVGGQVSSRWGDSTFALFLGYETARLGRPNGNALVGRFTFTRAWR